MARINRTDIIQKAVNDLAISTSTDKVPNETLDKVQLTYDLNRKFSSFILNNSKSTTGTTSLTLPTIDARSEIYLTSLDFHVVKDATCDVASGLSALNATSDFQGIGKSLVAISILTLTAQDQHVHVDFAYPLKLKANTNLTFGNTFSVGNMIISASVTGFITSSN